MDSQKAQISPVKTHNSRICAVYQRIVISLNGSLRTQIRFIKGLNEE
jgi:hypothetical protein